MRMKELSHRKCFTLHPGMEKLRRWGAAYDDEEEEDHGDLNVVGCDGEEHLSTLVQVLYDLFLPVQLYLSTLKMIPFLYACFGVPLVTFTALQTALSYEGP